MKRKVDSNRQMPIKTKGTASPEMYDVISTAEPYTLLLTLTGLPRTVNGSHQHWRVKHAQTKAWKSRVFAAVWPRRPAKPLEQARITYTRYSSTQPDFDNLVISFKACQDGLRQAGIIVDDRQANIRGEYRWEYAKPKAGRITVEVREVAP